MKNLPCLVLIMLMNLIPSSYAQLSIGTNHPELDWAIFETPHFKIIYHKGIEVLAEEVAHVAEEVYGPITQDLGVEPRGKIVIIVSDYDDISNGLSMPLGHYIFIWAQSFKKYTTGRMKWLRRVVAHEFTHQINFWGVRGFPGTIRELLALGFMPMWFVEGLAQYEAETWDTHRDLLLRVAAVDIRLLPSKKLEGFIGADQIDARLVYEQGHSLVRYIAAKYGPDKIQLILRKHRAFPFSFNWALKRAIKISEGKLYQDWWAEVTGHYLHNWKQKEKIEDIGRRFPSRLQGNYGLRWSPDGKKAAIVGVESYDEEVPRLYLCDPQTGGDLKQLAEPYVSGFFSWSPDSRYIVYSKKRMGRHGSLVDDLFKVDVQTSRNQTLTSSLRATDPDWSPDGKQIVFCIHQGSLSNLALLDVETNQTQALTSFEHWSEVFTPDWSPDGTQIAFSLFDVEGKRDIALINSDGTNFRKLTDDFEDDRYPVWSPDGQTIAFISYRKGYPNLFLIKPDGSGLVQVTDVAGGLFNPAWTPDGSKLTVVAFEKRNYVDLFTIDARRWPANYLSTGLEQQKILWQTATPPNVVPEVLELSAPTKLVFPKQAYRSLFNVRSQITIPFAGYDDAGVQGGILNYSADPLGKHQFLWFITQRKRTHYLLNYTNTQFLPTLSVALSQFTSDQGDFLEAELWEKEWSLAIELSVPFNFGQSTLSNHLIWLQGASSKTETLPKENFRDFPQESQPFQGWVNSLALGYSWAYARPTLTHDIHPKNGASVSSFVQRADRKFNSDLQYTSVAASLILRHQALVFKDHILALRLGGLWHDGQQPVQSRLALKNTTLRGLVDAIEGDKFIYANAEYRFPMLNDLGLKLWFLYIEGFYGAFYLDTGKVWGSYLERRQGTRQIFWRNREFSQADWVTTGGGELRCRVYLVGKLAVVFRGGMGMRLVEGEQPGVFILIGPVF